MTIRQDGKKRAYTYIMTQSRRLNFNLTRRSDNKTSNINYISLSDLVALKEGLIDLPHQLVVALKKLIKSFASEAEIEGYLVKPFRTKT